MSDPQEALTEVARQQAGMAARIHLPWWYVTLFAVVWTAVLAGPSAARDHVRLGIPQFPYTYAATLALLVLLVVFRRRSGLHTLWSSSPYPALKRQFARTAGLMTGSLLVVLGLYLLDNLRSVAPWAAVVAAALSGCLVSAQLRRVNHEIQRDIMQGRLDA